jgi:5-oxoprolinase (ATP-hydrolysing)
MGGAWRPVPVYRREELGCGEILEGPALIFERHSATVVTPGWTGHLDAAGALVLEQPIEGKSDDAS